MAFLLHQGSTDTMQTETAHAVKSAESGATVVITHRVRHGHQSDYEAWIREIDPVCRAAPGHLDLQIIRPVPGLTSTYTVVDRFDSRDNLERWLSSPERSRLIEKVRPILSTDDDFFIRTGLDFWFAPEGARARVPVRWRQFLITWSVIYPLVLGIPLLVTPALRATGVPATLFIDVLASTGIIVALMIYVVMPHYTRLVHRWLFR